MIKGFKVILIGFLVISLGFGTVYSLTLGNISTALNNPYFLLAYLSNNWENNLAYDKNNYTVLENFENKNDSLRRFQSIMAYEQNIINQGLIKWMTKNITMWMNTLATTNDKDSALQLLMQFLGENPKYQEHFKSYTMTLMYYYEALERQNMLEASMVDSHFIIKTGEIIEEWNVSTVIDGEPFTVICKQYSLEINGTPYTAVKAEAYNEDGILIADPDIYVKAPPYYYWYWYPWPWGQIIVYGQDDYIYAYLRFVLYIDDVPYYEEQYYLYDVIEDTELTNTIYAALTGILIIATGSVHPWLAAIPLIIGVYNRAENLHFRDAILAAATFNGEWGVHNSRKI